MDARNRLYLTNGRGMHITALTRCKFMLARIIRGKIDRFRTKRKKTCLPTLPF